MSEPQFKIFGMLGSISSAITDRRDLVRPDFVPVRRALGSGSVITDGSPRADVGSRGDTTTVLCRIIAAGSVALLGVRVSVGPGLTPGLVVAVVLLPVWLPRLAHFFGARLLLGGLLCTLVSGYLLSILDGAGKVIGAAQLNTTVLVATLISGIGVVLWSRTYFSAPQIGLIFGCGLLGNAMIGGNSVLAAGNPLKFVWAIPLTITILAIASLKGSWSLGFAALALVCVALTWVDARSLFAICFLSLIGLCWQLRRGRTSRGSSLAISAIAIGALAIAIYQFSTALVLDGVLGADAQARSTTQVDAGGSLLLGGRPEIGATLALMKNRPMGFGSGVVANASDINVAKLGMVSIGYDPNNGYVDNFMFGGEVELHSVFGDLWARFGIVGLAVAILLGLQIFRSIAVRISTRTANALELVLGFDALWNLCFSPIYASTPLLVITIGLLTTDRVSPVSSAALK